MTCGRWAGGRSSSQALALRCRLVLACAQGDRTHAEIAAELGCNPATVGKWRRRFAERRLDGLHDEPRPGKPRTISDQDVERVIVTTLEQTGMYQGVYHVLLGRLAPLEGVGPGELNVERLIERVKREKVREVILGTNPTLTCLCATKLLTAKTTSAIRPGVRTRAHLTARFRPVGRVYSPDS